MATRTRKTRAEKAIEDRVKAAYEIHGNRVQVPMLDLGKIHQAGMEAGRAGEDIDAAVKAAIARYRVG